MNMTKRFALSMMVMAVALPLCCTQASAQTAQAQEAYNIGVEAYVYFYPLVIMDVTRRQLTNIESGKIPARGPMNTFSHAPAYPTAEIRVIVRPNFDTLYSSAWLDLTKEPMIISVPDTNGRYYLLAMMDMWTDVFAAPGKRTSGTAAGNFAVVPPGWQGQLPIGVERIQSPTPYVWIMGRTQTNGPKDYEAVHKIQGGYRITPLSQWRKTPTPPAFEVDPSVDMKTPPLEQVNKMPAKTFFTYAAEIMKVNRPHVTDWSTSARLKRIGFEPGKSLDWDSLDPSVQDALTRAPVDGLKLMYAKAPTLARVVNGWQMNTDTIGVYGDYYLKRAIVAVVALAANQPLVGESNYVLHFEKSQLPPVNAFWSLTMYDQEGFQVANAINRFAIGDRDELKYNADGSLDLYIQHENPGPEKQTNWLPSPVSGTLGITLRLYEPTAEVLDGRWVPPAVRHVKAMPEPSPPSRN
jgi:hypothetical protein